MADIRIKDLPLAATPSASQFLPIDLTNTEKATIQTVVELGRPTASQAEAEAGINPTKAMTPLTTKQSIASEVGVSIASAAEGDLAVTALQPTAIGTSVQGYDAALQSIAGQTTSADQTLYTTGADTYATTSLTPFARTILDDVDAPAARTTLEAVQRLLTPGVLTRVYERFSLVDIDKNVGQLNEAVDTAAMLEAAVDVFGNTSSSIYQRVNGGQLHLGKKVILLNQSVEFTAAGVQIIGEGVESTKIYSTANIGSNALLKFAQSKNDYSDVGCGAQDFFVDMQGFTGHAIEWEKPYDGFSPKNLSVYGVHPDYNAYRIIPNPSNPDPASQTATLVNLIGAHVNSATATGSIFYCDSLQEAVFINCKGFGCLQAPGPETKANCYTFEFVDCRGISMVGNSSAFSQKHGIAIRAVTRPTFGFFINDHTYETIDGTLRAIGNPVTGNVSDVYHGPFRVEGAVENASLGCFDLDQVFTSQIYSRDKTIKLDSACDTISISSSDVTKITRGGAPNVDIIGIASSANGGARHAASSQTIMTHAGGSIFLEDARLSFGVSAANVGKMEYPFPAGYTSLYLAVNISGTVSVLPVTRDSNGFLKI